jgi:phosphopantothenoylcysteine decarboxylase/phosphopantothenate--cysteine ligase
MSPRPTVLLGVTGGIAAYKAAELVRLMVKAGLEVHVVMTEAATRFVTPLTFETLTRQPVGTSLWERDAPGRIEHIDLGRDVDLMILAPATADVIGKIACGLADDLLTTTVMASTKPVLLAPSMNDAMYDNPIVQANLARLAALPRYRVIPPSEGELACQTVGKGRLPEPATLLAHVRRALTPPRLAGRRVLVSAGATRAWLDDVRYVTNPSTGRMGFALAEAAWLAGAEVTLVTGPTLLPTPVGVARVEAETVAAMGQALSARVAEHDLLFMAAAVGDFEAGARAAGKIKKTAHPDGLTVHLVPAPDLLSGLADVRGACVTVGFAAETSDHERHALDKLARKRLDYLFLNPVEGPDAGFATPTNQGTLFSTRSGRRVDFANQPKAELASALLDAVLRDLGDPLNPKEVPA